MHESEKWKWSRSVVSDPQRPHGLQPSMLLRPWDFPGKSTGVGCHCLLRCILRPLLNLPRVFLNIFLIIFDYQQFHGQLWIERLNCVPDFIFPTNIHVCRKAYINTCLYIYIYACVLRYLVVSNSLQPYDCSPPGSSVHGILKTRILEWVAMLQEIFPTQGSNLHLYIAGRFFTFEPPGNPIYIYILLLIIVPLGRLLLDLDIQVNWYELKEKREKNNKLKPSITVTR